MLAKSMFTDHLDHDVFLPNVKTARFNVNALKACSLKIWKAK